MNSARPRARKSQENARVNNSSSAANVDPDAEVLGLEEELEDAEGGIRIGDIYVPPPPPPALTYDCTGPRLVISFIENYDFKSYAGKEILGPFHKSFSAIVGPNGSGKSNIIDSMLFVFGYRAQKIRSKNISVLIHSSSKFPDIEKCTVIVKFEKIVDDGDNYTVVAGSQFQVSRTAYKNNKSVYQIDGREVFFKDVGKLLRSQGIDLDHNRFLILQGEVEQIAMMKAKAQTEHDSGMLEYLEDIIGSHRFKKPIETLATQVEECSEARTEMLNRVKLLEKEKDNLEGPRNEAMQYLKTENKITTMKNKFLQVQQHNSKIGFAKSNEQYEEAKKELDIIEDQLNKVKGNLSEQQKQLKSKEKLLEKCHKTADSKKEQFSNLEKKDLEFREALKHAKKKIKSSKAELVIEEEKLVELQDLPDKVKEANVKLKREKEELEQKLIVEEKKLAEVVSTLKEETKNLQEEKDVHQNQLIGLQAKVDAAKKRLDVLKVELNVYLSADQKEKDKLKNYECSFEEVSKDIEAKKTNIESIERHLPETKSQLQKQQTELEQVIARETALAEKIRSDRMKVEEAKSNQQTNRSRGRIYDSLMMLKDKKQIPGILGRLGDLGGIDEKFDVAISSASGTLDHYVVDTVDTGQACIQYLKDNNLGVGHFLALDKIQWLHQKSREKIATPENVPRLFDLITVNDETVLVAFYFALRDTLVATNMDQALRIAYGHTRFRVVTLKGEVIDKEGTMTGGGGRARSGMMGKKAIVGRTSHEMETSFDMSVVQNDLEGYQREIQELRMRQRDLEESVRNLERDYRLLQERKQKGNRDLPVLITRRTELEKQIKDQEVKVAAAQPDQNRVKQLQGPIDAAAKEFEAATEAAGKVSVEVERVQDLIKEISNEKMGDVKKTVNSLKKKLKAAQDEINKGSVSAKTAERNMVKCNEKIISLKEDIAQYEKTIAKSGTELKQLEESAKKIMEELEIAKTERDEIDKEYKTLSKDLTEYKSKLKNLQESQVDAKTELEKYSAELSRVKQTLKSIQDKLSKLSLHKIDGPEDDQERNETELPKFTEEEIENLDYTSLKYEIEVAEELLKDKNCNMSAIENFRRKEKQYLDKVDELEEVTKVRDSKRQNYVQLKKERLNEFMNGFLLITNKLKEVYQMLTQGGDAELELVDSLDPFSDGIIFSVRPPKKSWKNISNLSGGEKTLSSLALVMALHYYRPTPLYVMDEIDAALDFRNVSIVGHYIKERTKNAQFIVISLRNNMYELADRLIGIYKTYDCTKSITIDPVKIIREIGGGGEPEVQKEYSREKVVEESEVMSQKDTEDEEEMEIGTDADLF